MSATFKDRLIEAMSIRNLTQSDLVRLTGLSKPRISQYVNGTYEAKQKALYILAEALDVNILWLMGNDVPMDATSKPAEPQPPIQLDDFTYAMYQQSGELTEEQKRAILHMVEVMKQSRGF